jgi:Xaa-Pro aminopeptidase
MERDEAAAAAARSGMHTKNLADYNYMDLLKAANGDHAAATAERYRQMLVEQGIVSGKVLLYGRVEAGPFYSVIAGLQKLLPEVEFQGELNEQLLLEAMMTKDPQEVERIRQMGKITTEVVGRTADFLTSHAVKQDVLVKPDGAPLTIGEVKSKINLWLAELGAENPEGTIFSIGRDAGVPHSVGGAGDLLRLGQTIVYDIFPCETGGGYYYDFTRTWCLGHAPDEALKLYEDVRSVYTRIMSELQINQPFSHYQKRACDLFEAQGHPTIQTDLKTESGYVHSLGHGLGLRVHERPMSGRIASEKDRLYPGAVFTIEPGLYYPERGLGVRLEDTVTMCPDGKPEILAEYPLDLVLKMKG